MFSTACEYGIRSSLYVASRENEGFVPIREIAEDLGISHHFLTKVLQDLTKVGIMKSLRGPNGGVALNRASGSIFLIDIVIAIDGIERFEGCVLGLPSCGDRLPCPLHQFWGTVRDRVRDKFQAVSLLALAERIQQEGLRISSLTDC